MKPTNFAYLLTRYLGQYLPGQRNLSGQTIASYRDTFKLLLRFCQTEQGWAAEQITLAHLDRLCLEGFLEWLESTRHCRVATRNQRLAALRAFFRWVSYEAPEQLESTQRILGIPWKKTPRPMMALESSRVPRSPPVLQSPTASLEPVGRHLPFTEIHCPSACPFDRGISGEGESAYPATYQSHASLTSRRQFDLHS